MISDSDFQNWEKYISIVLSHPACWHCVAASPRNEYSDKSKFQTNVGCMIIVCVKMLKRYVAAVVNAVPIVLGSPEPLADNSPTGSQHPTPSSCIPTLAAFRGRQLVPPGAALNQGGVGAAGYAPPPSPGGDSAEMCNLQPPSECPRAPQQD